MTLVFGLIIDLSFNYTNITFPFGFSKFQQRIWTCTILRQFVDLYVYSESTVMLLVLIAAVLPAIVLIIHIYKRDKWQKEPPRQLFMFMHSAPSQDACTAG